MTGSIAQGCMVVLIGKFDNITVNLKRGTNIEAVIDTTYPTSCYNKVIAFDIESAGSVGRLAVPGKILPDTTSNSVFQCLQNAPSPSKFLLYHHSWGCIMCELSIFSYRATEIYTNNSDSGYCNSYFYQLRYHLSHHHL